MNALKRIITSDLLLLIPAVISLVLGFAVILIPGFRTVTGTITLPQSITDLPSQVASLQNDLATLQQRIDLITQIPADNIVSVRLTELQVHLDDLSTRLQKLEQAILSDPAKALELPLLQRDLEMVQNSQIEQGAALQNQLNQFVDLGKWFIGSFVVAIFSLVINSFLRSRGGKTE